MVDPISASETATKRGTRIVKKGQEVDKNAFLKILAAELTHQDPMNAKDSTAYVSQLAQFSSLEQMANLNSTMSFNSASNLVGKMIALRSYDSYGNQYGGVVKNINKVGDTIKVMVNVPKFRANKIVGYEDKEFLYSDVSEILGKADTNSQILDAVNQNMNFMIASSLIDKTVEFKSQEDGKNYSGKIKEVFKTDKGIKLKVDLGGKEEEISLYEVMKVKN